MREIIRKRKLAPGVKEEMLKANFWINKLDNPHQILLNEKEKKDFYFKSLKRAEEKNLEVEYCDLKSYPDSVTAEFLQEIMNDYSNPDELYKKKYYDFSGVEINEQKKRLLEKRSNLYEIKEKIKVKWGIIIKRENLRAYPTEDVFAGKPEAIDQDLLQLTALSAGTPLAVLHKSLDGKWLFVQSPFYRGWVKKVSVALTDNCCDVFYFQNASEFLVVKESRVRTEPNPFLPEISNILFQMGDKIPLLADEKVPFSFPPENQQAQSAEGCYCVKIPIRDNNGYLQYKSALMARSSGLNVGYLKYTRANLIKQAFKMLGERYGWGGLYERRDCSRFIMDIYRSVGIILPRDAGPPQEKIPPGKTIKFSGTTEDRIKIMEELKPGDPIYMKGHVVMYLGEDGGEHYVIHAGSGYAYRDKNDEIHPRTVHGVFVMKADQLLKSGKETYLKAFKLARSFV